MMAEAPGQDRGVPRCRLLGVGLATAGAFLAACNRLTGRTPPVPTTGPVATSQADRLPDCVLTPAQTEGLYFVDEQLNRSDIRVDPSDGSVRSIPVSL